MAAAGPGVPVHVDGAHASRSPTAAGVTLTRGEETFHVTGEDGAQFDIPQDILRKSKLLLDLWDDGYDDCRVSVSQADLASWLDINVSGFLHGGPRDAAKRLVDMLLVCHLQTTTLRNVAVHETRCR